MERKLERTLVTIMGVWQIIDGLITIFIYGSFQKYKGALLIENTSFAEMKAIESITGSLYMFITMFGIILIGIGLFHLVCVRKYLKDNQVYVKLAIWLFVCGGFSYLVMDLLSVVLSMSAGILILAKNKSIKKSQLV